MPPVIWNRTTRPAPVCPHQPKIAFTDILNNHHGLILGFDGRNAPAPVRSAQASHDWLICVTRSG